MNKDRKPFLAILLVAAIAIIGLLAAAGAFTFTYLALDERLGEISIQGAPASECGEPIQVEVVVQCEQEESGEEICTTPPPTPTDPVDYPSPTPTDPVDDPTPTPTDPKDTPTPTKPVDTPTPTDPADTPTPTKTNTPKPPTETPVVGCPDNGYQYLIHKPGTPAEQVYCCDSDRCVRGHLSGGHEDAGDYCIAPIVSPECVRTGGWSFLFAKYLEN